MALTIKHLNSDASFLLTLEPIVSGPPQGSGVQVRPFTILLDPWIIGPSKIFHPTISISTHKHPACILSLADLPEPDLVIISQHKSDHCNEATLRQLPPTGTKTLILAEPASARLIRSWKYFDRDKIRTIETWKDPRLTGKSTVIRIPVPAVAPGGQKGEVTVAWIPQKRDIAGLHGAIGITYQPPSSCGPFHVAKFPISSSLLTPPATPLSTRYPFNNPLSTTLSTADTLLLPPSPPISPRSLRSVQSASTLIASPTSSRPFAALASWRPSSASRSQQTLIPAPVSRTLSLIFSPHGISYAHLAPYATSHLVAEAALPLTALLHCMDSISNPWWLGGNICTGAPTGADIAMRLGARVWVSAHDGEKNVKGLATTMLRTRRYAREEVEEVIGPRGVRGAGPGVGTEVLRLGSGEEVAVAGDGMLWLGSDGVEEKSNATLSKEKEMRTLTLGELLPPTIEVSMTR